MTTATPSTVDRLVARAAEERWSSTRLDAAIARARELRADAAGKPCGASFIPREATCHKGLGALTPATVTRAPREGSSWRRKAATAAGITAAGLAIGLPSVSFLQSGTPTGRRVSMKVEGFAREAVRGLMTWGSGPLAPVGLPLGMGLGAAAEGMRAGRTSRRITESWRAAPGFARDAAGLAARKGASAAARESYIASMKNAWASGTKPITPAAARKRAAEVRKVEEQITALSRQQATRQRAARRAARISRTGAPFTASTTVSEAWLRESLQSDPISRTPPSTPAGPGFTAPVVTRRPTAWESSAGRATFPNRMSAVRAPVPRALPSPHWAGPDTGQDPRHRPCAGRRRRLRLEQARQRRSAGRHG